LPVYFTSESPLYQKLIEVAAPPMSTVEAASDGLVISNVKVLP